MLNELEAAKVSFTPGISALIWSFNEIPSSEGIFRLSSKQCKTDTSKSTLSKTNNIPAAVYTWQQGAHLKLWGLSERAGKLTPVTTELTPIQILNVPMEGSGNMPFPF